MNRPTSLRRYFIGRHKLAFTITSLFVASSIVTGGNGVRLLRPG